MPKAQYPNVYEDTHYEVEKVRCATVYRAHRSRYIIHFLLWRMLDGINRKSINSKRPTIRASFIQRDGA